VTAGLTFPAFLARRFALLVFTLVLVPSLSFVMFTLIRGGLSGPVDLLEQLWSYLVATFWHGSVGGEHFQYNTYIRTRTALEVVKEGFVVDVYLLAGALISAVLIGLVAGSVQATHPRSVVSRVIAVFTALAMSSPVYWLGLIALLLFAPGIGSVAEIPFLSTVNGYRPPGDDPIEFVHGLWLPCAIVGLPLAASCARMCASQLLGTLHEASCGPRAARASASSGSSGAMRCRRRRAR
jgi:ABC-type dipeptide/oligopeptide/nickel transport system permease component